MKISQLQYLVTTAREGSISRAASALGLAQPAISQQLRALEKDLGAELFYRTQKGSSLTIAGQIMFEHAQQVLERLEMARADVRANANEVSGEVSLHLNNSIAEQLLPPLVRILNERFPRIRLRVTPLPSELVQRNVENGRADLGVLPDRDSLRKVNAKQISTEPLVLISAPFHPIARKKNIPITLEEASRLPLATVRDDQPFRAVLEQAMKKNRLHLNVRFESNLLLMIFSHVYSGMACSILARCAVMERAQAGKIVMREIIEPRVRQDYLVVWPKSLPLTAASAKVRDLILDIEKWP